VGANPTNPTKRVGGEIKKNGRKTKNRSS
jgi:hypothetical protein